MAEEQKKLGAVKYTNPDKSARVVRVHGLVFREGETVDVRKQLGDARAEPILQKLAGNHYFQVEGGPDHSALQQDMASRALMAEAASDPVIREEQEARMRGQEPPENYDAPLQPVLESQGSARPNLPGREKK